MADPVDLSKSPSALSAFNDGRSGTPELNTDDAQKNSAVAQTAATSEQSMLDYKSTDPDFVKTLEHFEGMSHDEIYSHVKEMDVGGMHHFADQWEKIASELSGGLFGMQISIEGALAHGIEGKIADAALAAAHKFYTQANDVQAVIGSCGSRIRAAAETADVVKRSVPPTAGPLGGPNSPDQILGMQVAHEAKFAGLVPVSASDAVAYQKGVDALHQTAINAMNTHYKPAYPAAGTGVATFVAVQNPGDGNQNPNPGIASPGTGPGNSLPNGADHKNPAQQPDNSQQTKPSSVDSSQFPNAAGNQTMPNSGVNPLNSSPAGPGLTTNAAGYDGGGAGLGSAGGFGGAGGGANLGNSGGPGRSLPGVQGLGSSAAAAASAAGGGKGGAAGLNGMPGMGGAGARKSEKESEQEHKSADYLVMNREEELIGHIDPMAPGAIGANFPAAQTRRVDSEEDRK